MLKAPPVASGAMTHAAQRTTDSPTPSGHVPPDSAEAMKKNPDIQEFYLGGREGRDFNEIKHYRRRKRWLS